MNNYDLLNANPRRKNVPTTNYCVNEEIKRRDVAQLSAEFSIELVDILAAIERMGEGNIITTRNPGYTLL